MLPALNHTLYKWLSWPSAGNLSPRRRCSTRNRHRWRYRTAEARVLTPQILGASVIVPHSVGHTEATPARAAIEPIIAVQLRFATFVPARALFFLFLPLLPHRRTCIAVNATALHVCCHRSIRRLVGLGCDMLLAKRAPQYHAPKLFTTSSVTAVGCICSVFKAVALVASVAVER